MKIFDLNVDAPEKLAQVLRTAADSFNESEGELSAAWQDPNAGKIWSDFARILNRAADSAERALARRGL